MSVFSVNMYIRHMSSDTVRLMQEQSSRMRYMLTHITIPLSNTTLIRYYGPLAECFSPEP